MEKYSSVKLINQKKENLHIIAINYNKKKVNNQEQVEYKIDNLKIQFTKPEDGADFMQEI